MLRGFASKHVKIGFEFPALSTLDEEEWFNSLSTHTQVMCLVIWFPALRQWVLMATQFKCNLNQKKYMKLVFLMWFFPILLVRTTLYLILKVVYFWTKIYRKVSRLLSA